MACTNWLGTINNPTVEPQDFLSALFKKMNAVYVVGQLEKGAEGTPHIQFFVNLKKPGCRLAALRKIDPRGHYEEVRVNNGADAYCMKQETRLDGPWEFGCKPVKHNNKKDWEEVKKNAVEGNLDKIPAEIYVKHYQTLKMIAKDHQVIPPRTVPKKCYWIWGKPGTGKTRGATLTYPNAYRKLQNKWWDGYQDQKEVILDDLGVEVGKMLGTQMKLWADPWNNQLGEVKGSYANLNYDTFVVTSNYHPSDIWAGVDLEAILRRFEIRELTPEYLEFHPGKVFEF